MSTTPGMSWRAVEQAFTAFVKSAINLEAIWSFGKGAQPTRPYVRLQWLGFGHVGDSGFVETFNTTTRKVEKAYYASRTAQVDVQVITDEIRAGENSLTYADALMVAFDIADLTYKWLAPVGVAVADFDGARNLDAVEDGGKPVSRTSFTLNLNIAVNVDAAFTVPNIETVEATGTIDGGVQTDNGGDITVEGS